MPPLWNRSEAAGVTSWDYLLMVSQLVPSRKITLQTLASPMLHSHQSLKCFKTAFLNNS